CVMASILATTTSSPWARFSSRRSTTARHCSWISSSVGVDTLLLLVVPGRDAAASDHVAALARAIEGGPLALALLRGIEERRGLRHDRALGASGLRQVGAGLLPPRPRPRSGLVVGECPLV